MSYEYPYEDDWGLIGPSKEDMARRRDEGVTHGSRTMDGAGDGKLYRVHIYTEYERGSYWPKKGVDDKTEVLGPYATPAIAKGIRTQNLPRNGKTYPQGDIFNRTITIQVTETVWKDIDL